MAVNYLIEKSRVASLDAVADNILHDAKDGLVSGRIPTDRQSPEGLGQFGGTDKFNDLLAIRIALARKQPGLLHPGQDTL